MFVCQQLLLEFKSRLDAHIEKNVLKNLSASAREEKSGRISVQSWLKRKKTHVDLAHKGNELMNQWMNEKGNEGFTIFIDIKDTNHN